jgi:tRNA_anti-like
MSPPSSIALERKGKMKTQKNPVTLLVIFGLWLGLILGCSSLRNSAPIKISAEDLSKAYESNEITANDRYRGETLIVTGKVGITNIPEGATPPPSFHFGDAPLVVCFAEQKDEVSQLKIGQTVTVKGKCTGSVLGFVTLMNCVIQ